MRVMVVRAHLALAKMEGRRYRLVEGSRSFLFEFRSDGESILAGAVAHLLTGELGQGDSGEVELNFWAEPVWPLLVPGARFIVMYPRAIGFGHILSAIGIRDLE